MRNDLQLRKVLIVFESQSKYSESLKGEFANTLRYSLDANKQNIQFCDLSTETKEDCIQKAQQANVEALMLAPSGNKLEVALDIARILKQNSTLVSLQLLAGDVLYDKKTFEKLGNTADGMVVAVSSHASLANQNFVDTANNLWRTKNVSWITLTSYDAAQAFLQVLTTFRNQGVNNPTREEVYEKLKDHTFSAPGATRANVEFNHEDDKHDRKTVTGVGVLVRADTQNFRTSDEYRFIHLKTPERNNRDNF
jgi:serine/threonine-protein kinase